MKEIFDIASQVSTPLALSGLVTAFLFFGFRQIIARNIFPRLTQALGGKVLLTIINYLFILALVAMVLGFFGYILNLVAGHPATPEESRSIAFPPGTTLQQAIKMIAEDESCTAVFQGCPDTVLSSKVESGSIKAGTAQDLMELVQHKLIQGSPKVRYRVRFLKEKGIYEILCE